MKKLFMILLLVLVLCFGLYNCKSPAKPEGPGTFYKYRYNVEVIYTRVTVDHPEGHAEGQDFVRLTYHLYDPALFVAPNPRYTDNGFVDMEEIGENKYRGYLPKAFIQNSRNPRKHDVSVSDYIARGGSIAERIDIQGAYEWEITNNDFGLFINSRLYFKMSKE